MAKIVKYPNLVSEIARNGETQGDIARLLNLKQSAVSRRMSGITKWTIEEVFIICKHYNKEYEELFK